MQDKEITDWLNEDASRIIAIKDRANTFSVDTISSDKNDLAGTFDGEINQERFETQVWCAVANYRDFKRKGNERAMLNARSHLYYLVKEIGLEQMYECIDRISFAGMSKNIRECVDECINQGEVMEETRYRQLYVGTTLLERILKHI